MIQTVDYFIGATPIAMLNKRKFFFEYYKHLKKDIDPKIIWTRIGPKTRINIPMWDLFTYTLYHPLVVTTRRRKDSILHIPTLLLAYVLSWHLPPPMITTCYDIIPFLPSAYKLSYVRFDKRFLRLLRKGLTVSSMIIASSNYTKGEIVRFLNIPPDKIHVIYCGVDHTRYKPQKVEYEDVHKYGFEKDAYNLLYMGSEAPRKNIKMIIMAVCIAKKKGLNVNIIKIGSSIGHSREELLKLVGSLGMQNNVHLIDYVPENILPKIYCAADLFVFPSLYEGFGLPPLEAMACGCPVITSNTSSLPEVVGDAGIMIDPKNVDALADAMYSVLTNEGLRQDMIKKGLKRAKIFNWEKTAKETLRVYEGVYNE